MSLRRHIDYTPISVLFHSHSLTCNFVIVAVFVRVRVDSTSGSLRLHLHATLPLLHVGVAFVARVWFQFLVRFGFSSSSFLFIRVCVSFVCHVDLTSG